MSKNRDVLYGFVQSLHQRRGELMSIGSMNMKRKRELSAINYAIEVIKAQAELVADSRSSFVEEALKRSEK